MKVLGWNRKMSVIINFHLLTLESATQNGHNIRIFRPPIKRFRVYPTCKSHTTPEYNCAICAKLSSLFGWHRQIKYAMVLTDTITNSFLAADEMCVKTGICSRRSISIDISIPNDAQIAYENPTNSDSFTHWNDDNCTELLLHFVSHQNVARF